MNYKQVIMEKPYCIIQTGNINFVNDKMPDSLLQTIIVQKHRINNQELTIKYTITTNNASCGSVID
jgi:hypothetical protein